MRQYSEGIATELSMGYKRGLLARWDAKSEARASLTAMYW